MLIVRYNSASLLWNAGDSSAFSSMRYSTYRAHIAGSNFRKKSATSGRGKSTSSDVNIYLWHQFQIHFQDTRERPHFKRNVSVLLKHPSGMLEDQIQVFRPESLEIVDRRHEFVSQVCLLLAQPDRECEFFTNIQEGDSLLPQQVHGLPVHLLPIIQVDQLRIFLCRSERQTLCAERAEYTSLARSTSSTSETSHQLPTLHNGASRPGRTSR